MKGRLILLGACQGREAAALMVDGRLEDLLVTPAKERPVPGDICRAVADRPMKGLGGMFVRLPDGNGFLRQTKGVVPGRPLLVQVTGYADSDKATPVSTRLSIKGRYVILTPDAPGRNVSRRITDAAQRERLGAIAEGADLPGNTGLIVRSEADGATDNDVTRETAQLSELAAKILGDVPGPPELLLAGPGPHQTALRDWGAADVHEGPGVFIEHGVEEAMAALLTPEVQLPGGGRMTIEPTRALVAVDVDTGGNTSPAAGLSADIAAARALPRELRCRGLGGQITIDFAPIARKDRQRVEQALTSAFRADFIETIVAGWTPLSHMELRRQRSRLPLKECLEP